MNHQPVVPENVFSPDFKRPQFFLVVAVVLRVNGREVETAGAKALGGAGIEHGRRCQLVVEGDLSNDRTPCVIDRNVVDRIFEFLLFLFVAKADAHPQARGQVVGEMGKGGIGISFDIPGRHAGHGGDAGKGFIVDLLFIVVEIEAEKKIGRSAFCVEPQFLGKGAVFVVLFGMHQGQGGEIVVAEGFVFEHPSGGDRAQGDIVVETVFDFQGLGPDGDVVVPVEVGGNGAVRGWRNGKSHHVEHPGTGFAQPHERSAVIVLRLGKSQGRIQGLGRLPPKMGPAEPVFAVVDDVAGGAAF